MLLNSRHNELEKIQVQGHLIKSGTGITTKSKAKSAPDQWALLADALTEIQEQVLAGEDEDSDWEEVQTDGIESDKEFLHSVSALGKPSYEHLEAMAKVFNEDQDDQYEDDLLNVADPLNQINLVNYLVDFFANFSQSDRQLRSYLQELDSASTKCNSNDTADDENLDAEDNHHRIRNVFGANVDREMTNRSQTTLSDFLSPNEWPQLQ